MSTYHALGTVLSILYELTNVIQTTIIYLHISEEEIEAKKNLKTKVHRTKVHLHFKLSHSETRVCIINHYFIGVFLNKNIMYIILLILNNPMK